MTAVFLALAVGVAATTITKAKAFQPLRSYAKARNTWAGYLVGCPYCTSHWLMFAAQAVYRVRLTHSGAPALDVAVSSFPLIGLAALVPALLTRVYHFEPDVRKNPRYARRLSERWRAGCFPEGHFDRD